MASSLRPDELEITEINDDNLMTANSAEKRQQVVKRRGKQNMERLFEDFTFMIHVLYSSSE